MFGRIAQFVARPVNRRPAAQIGWTKAAGNEKVGELRIEVGVGAGNGQVFHGNEGELNLHPLDVRIRRVLRD